MHHRILRSVPVLTLAVLLAGFPVAARAEGWGNIKGRIVYAGDPVKRAEIKPDKDQAHCLSRGPLLDDRSYVVNPKNKGVRWVMVWLIDPVSPANKLAIHPSLAKVKEAQVVIDQPCCNFEPHIVCLREGQVLVAKNSSPIVHNVNVQGGLDNPNLNQIVPPGGKLEVEGWKATRIPASVACNVHGWMKACVGVFSHPYFAITDADGNFEIRNAPAGKLSLVTWHEAKGWVQGNKKGTPIEIKAGATTDLGKIDLKPS